MEFNVIKIEELELDPFTAFKNWAMITAKVNDKHNSMIIGWGGFGVLWRKDVATVYIRENRYSYEFFEKADLFTISFYDEKYKKELAIYGTKSGRELDKDQATGFHPIEIDGAIIYEEAHTSIVCRKIYQAKLEPKYYFNDTANDFYRINDDETRHHMYIGEIIKVIKK